MRRGRKEGRKGGREEGRKGGSGAGVTFSLSHWRRRHWQSVKRRAQLGSVDRRKGGKEGGGRGWLVVEGSLGMRWSEGGRKKGGNEGGRKEEREGRSKKNK